MFEKAGQAIKRIAPIIEPGSSLLPLGVYPGSPYGPLLLWPGADERPRWVIGRWTGEQWCDEDGQVFTPTAWSSLPPPAWLQDEAAQ